MSIYACEIRIFGTVYIKAANPGKARRILDRLCGNTLDAKDRVWFSEASFEALPRVSFSTSFMSDGLIQGARLVEMNERAVKLAQRSFFAGSRDYVMPYASRAEEFEDTPVFSVDVDITTTAFVCAKDAAEADATIAEFKDSHIDLSMGYWAWFSTLGLEGPDGDFPIALSSALYVVAPSNGCELYRRWPEVMYKQDAEGNRVEVVEEGDYPVEPRPTHVADRAI